jgi:hypothetical protein
MSSYLRKEIINNFTITERVQRLKNDDMLIFERINFSQKKYT